MLQGIFDILKKIGDFFTSIVDFIVSFFGDVVKFVKMLGTFASKIPDWFSWLPAPVLALIVILVGVIILIRVLGRD